ncbi:MAG: O-methyltransferase [Candidatus Eisenbacteria bacterium]|nr:O-methyltransferase [Candidatus Eisenbacteria bacterium]
MSEGLWTEVDTFFGDTLAPEDPAFASIRETNAVAGLPAIDVSRMQGKLLHLLARMQGARRILEVGTLGGYSATWMARALPVGGRLITLEIDAARAETARANLARCGVADRVEVRVGAALDTLRALAEEGAAPFDLTFIDADKQNNANYLEWAIKLSRPGSVIIVDNVVREGAVADASSTDPAVLGTRRVIEAMGRHPRLSATAIQTVGTKGYDGFALAYVLPA